MNVTLEYLRMTAEAVKHAPQGFVYSSLFEFALTHGKMMKPPVEMPFARVERGIPRQCFMNAANLAMGRRGFIYCEGWAMSVIPVPHAWNLVEYAGELRVLDITWRTPGTEYFGMAFKTAYLKKQLSQQKYFGLIDAWDVGWPLLKMKPSQTKQWKHPIMEKL